MGRTCLNRIVSKPCAKVGYTTLLFVSQIVRTNLVHVGAVDLILRRWLWLFSLVLNRLTVAAANRIKKNVESQEMAPKG